jgi:hypothetical protein
MPSYDAKGNANRAAEQFQKACELHELVLAEIDDPAATRILAYFRTWEPSKAAAVLVHEPQDTATRSLVFRWFYVMLRARVFSMKCRRSALPGNDTPPKRMRRAASA